MFWIMALKYASTFQLPDPMAQNAPDTLRAIGQLELVTFY